MKTKTKKVYDLYDRALERYSFEFSSVTEEKLQNLYEERLGQGISLFTKDTLRNETIFRNLDNAKNKELFISYFFSETSKPEEHYASILKGIDSSTLTILVNQRSYYSNFSLGLQTVTFRVKSLNIEVIDLILAAH